MDNIKNLTSEKKNYKSTNLNSKSNKDIIKLIYEEQKSIYDSVSDYHYENISKLVDLANKTISNNGRIIYLAISTSARVAWFDCTELYSSYQISEDLIFTVMPGNKKESYFRSDDSLEDDLNQSIYDLSSVNLSKNDLVIGLSVSGRSPYIIKGLEYSKSLSAKTACITNIKNSEVSKYSDIEICQELGPELISGSGRMKAASFQKDVLTAFSTTLMLRMNNIHNNMMINFKLQNKKLVVRAINILIEIFNIEEYEAINLLENSNNNLKLAILNKSKQKL